MCTEPVEAIEYGRRLSPKRRTDRLSARVVHVQPREGGRERGYWGRPRVQIRRRRGLEQTLNLARARDESGKGGVRLRQAADEDDVVIGLVEVLDHPVAPRPVRTLLVGCALADDAETVGVVDVEQRAMRAGELRQGRDVGCVASHAVDAVDANHPRPFPAFVEEPLELL